MEVTAVPKSEVIGTPDLQSGENKTWYYYEINTPEGKSSMVKAV